MHPQLLKLHLRFTGRGDRGATAIEYSLMVSLIAIVIIGAVMLFADSVNVLFVSNASSV